LTIPAEDTLKAETGDNVSASVRFRRRWRHARKAIATIALLLFALGIGTIIPAVYLTNLVRSQGARLEPSNQPAAAKSNTSPENKAGSFTNHALEDALDEDNLFEDEMPPAPNNIRSATPTLPVALKTPKSETHPDRPPKTESAPAAAKPKGVVAPQ